MDRLLTTDEVAETLRCSVEKVRDLARSELPHVRGVRGGRLLFEPRVVREWVASHTVVPERPRPTTLELIRQRRLGGGGRPS